MCMDNKPTVNFNMELENTLLVYFFIQIRFNYEFYFDYAVDQNIVINLFKYDKHPS